LMTISPEVYAQVCRARAGCQAQRSRCTVLAHLDWQ
jgi:hypothetical protein